MIHALVHRFYGKVRGDAVLGPIFARVIAKEGAESAEKIYFG